jgi:hypothetical protein
MYYRCIRPAYPLQRLSVIQCPEMCKMKGTKCKCKILFYFNILLQINMTPKGPQTKIHSN